MKGVEARGAQFAGVANIVGGDVDGFQVSGGLNAAGRNVEGSQASGGLNAIGGDLNGFQVAAGINVTGGSVRGFQASGGGNFAARNLQGLQITPGAKSRWEKCAKSRSASRSRGQHCRGIWRGRKSAQPLISRLVRTKRQISRTPAHRLASSISRMVILTHRLDFLTSLDMYGRRRLDFSMSPDGCPASQSD